MKTNQEILESYRLMKKENECIRVHIMSTLPEEQDYLSKVMENNKRKMVNIRNAIGRMVNIDERTLLLERYVLCETVCMTHWSDVASILCGRTDMSGLQYCRRLHMRALKNIFFDEELKEDD